MDLKILNLTPKPRSSKLLDKPVNVKFIASPLLDIKTFKELKIKHLKTLNPILQVGNGTCIVKGSQKGKTDTSFHGLLACITI